MRTPTRNQHAKLTVLASGAAGLSWKPRDVDPLLRWGWVTAERDDRYYQWVRITPDGLRALALAVERFGLPDFKRAEARTTRRVCADCGSRTYRFESQSAADAIAEAA